jgi:predicted Holliday junction resolvase-like endonuclease
MINKNHPSVAENTKVRDEWAKKHPEWKWDSNLTKKQREECVKNSKGKLK